MDPAVSTSDLPNDVDALKAMVIALKQNEVTSALEIEKLKAQLARLRRQHYGRSSERLSTQIEQLELAIEAGEEDLGEDLAASTLAVAQAVEAELAKAASTKPARRPLPAELPRDEVVHPAPCTCPGCGGDLRKIGDEISETLDYVPGHFKVTRHIRPKLSCRACDTVVAAEAPSHAIPRGRAGPGLLAQIAVSKYDDHLPLYRQAEIYARDGIDLDRSTLAGWVGATATALAPLLDALAAEVMASAVLHVDDTPVRVLAKQKTREGRLWVYVRDQRPCGGTSPAALYFYSPNRKGEHPRAHLATFKGVIHADGYTGFEALFDPARKPGLIVEAACWAHVRRYFFDDYQSNKLPLAGEALARIGQLYEVEQEIRGKPPDERRRVRQARSVPIAESLKAWAEDSLGKISGKSDLAVAFRYMLNRWQALTRCFDDGRLEIDNNAAERALRGIAVGRKNWLFAGSDRGGQRAAALYSLIETAKLNSHDPRAYLADVLMRIADHPMKRIAELLPWNWAAPAKPAAIANAA
jgi:transposase